jgi:DNA invertase Pin-like site-specific DNA recombinase
MAPRTASIPDAAIGLVRVSTDEQAGSGLGLAAQRHAIEQVAAAQGLQLLRVVEEAGVSGGAPIEKRDGLLEAIDAVPKGGVLLVAKLDRIARDQFVAAWVEKQLAVKGARIVSAAGEGTGEGDELGNLILRRVTELFAEYERRLIKVRTKAALAAKRRRGEKLGGHPPIGFKVEHDGEVKRLVPCPDGLRTLRLVGQLAATKHPTKGRPLSLREIGKQLVSAGHLPAAGGQWHAKTIATAVVAATKHQKLIDAVLGAVEHVESKEARIKQRRR